MSDMKVYGAGMAVPQRSYSNEPQKSPAAAGEEIKKAETIQTPAEPEEKAPTLYEMMQEAREKAEARKKSLQLPKNGSQYGYAPVEAHARLARAKNHAQVSSASGYARRRIAQLKTAMRQDSDNAGRIRAAINQLQKVVQRAGKKRRDLDSERLTEVRRKKSEQEDQRKEALRLRQYLLRRRTMRVIRESGYIREAVIDNQLQGQLSATQMELREQAQALSSLTSPTVDAAVQQYTAQMSTPVEGTAEINVQA